MFIFHPSYLFTILNMEVQMRIKSNKKLITNQRNSFSRLICQPYYDTM